MIHCRLLENRTHCVCVGCLHASCTFIANVELDKHQKRKESDFGFAHFGDANPCLKLEKFASLRRTVDE